eukprot:GHVN01035588.1.p1 GENE.GHVN01035588.1~~GHVN01035588.1.p1  ORF type:complete len:222 (+),score=15.34 GHVN01035588.1:119-784(+)
MDFPTFFTGMWEAMTCQGVSCFERYSTGSAIPRQHTIPNEPYKPRRADSEWSEGEEHLAKGESISSLEKYRRKLSARVKLIRKDEESKKETETRVSLRVSDDGKTMTWSTERSPRTYSGLIGGISVDDISEVVIEPSDDRIVLLSAFDETYADENDTEGTLTTTTTKFKFRTSDSLTQWVADLDRFLEEFAPPEEKEILDFQDTSGRMSEILRTGTMRHAL